MQNPGRNRSFVAIVVVVAVVLVALAAVFWWQSTDATVPAPVAKTPAPPEPPQPATARLENAAPSPERTAAPAPTPTAPTVDPLLAHVRGRCVDEQGAPLAGCKAAFDAWGGNNDRMAMQGKVDWHDPEPIVTATDGRFDFAFAPPSGMQFSLDVAAEGRVPRTGRWFQLAPAQVIDLGDIVLGRGCVVRGRVVDEQGAPVPKVSVMLHNLPLPIAANMAANDVRYGSSDAAGDFQIGVPIPVGTWSLDVRSRGMRLVSPAHVTVTDRGAEPLLVTVRSMPSISGLVVDDLGQPVQDVEVRAAFQRSGLMASGRSRKDGTFTIHAVDAEPKPVRLEIDDPGPCEPPEKADERLYEWGTRDVRIELHRATACELVVVERATGAPVTQFAVSCASTRANSSLQSDLRLSGEHPGGRVTIDRVWRGKNRLQVMPLDPALVPSAPVEFEATDAGAPAMRVELDRLAPVTVRVTKADGSPIVGSKVEVVAKGTEPFAADTWLGDGRTGSRGGSSDPAFRPQLLVSQAVSAADGRAAVFVPPRPDGLAVRVMGAHPPALVDPAQFVPGQDLVVVLPAAGSIVGVVRLQGLDPARIRISPVNGQSNPHTRSDATGTVLADGSFALRNLLPGRYQLRITYLVPFRTEHGGSSGAIPLDVPVPQVAVEADHESRVDIDATAIVPASVHGRVLIDGAPPAAARVFLDQERGGRFGQFVVAADGTFAAKDLLPGKYWLNLVVGDFQAGPGDTVRSDTPFELTAGQQFARDFVFVRRRLVITVLQADGKTPAANLKCMLRGERLMLRALTTDTNGRLVLDPAPMGALHVQPFQLRKEIGTVQLAEGQTSAEVTLTLPAPEPGK